jgi:hypothetical protein
MPSVRQAVTLQYRMRVTVEIDRGPHPPQGWVEDEDGRRASFVGMVELFALLDGSDRPLASQRPEHDLPDA